MVEAWAPEEMQGHNICGRMHNKVATCGLEGPPSIEECRDWFWGVWQLQFPWMDKTLADAQHHTWQIIVTHFPPRWFSSVWNCFVAKHGVDFFVAGHIHRQEIVGQGEGGFLPGNCHAISGGGGGITSENEPAIDGQDDQYGFLDLEFSPTLLTVKAISHGGVLRKTITCPQRFGNEGQQCSGGRRLDEVAMSREAVVEDLMNV